MKDHTKEYDDDYTKLVNDAVHAVFEGWDFSFIRERMIESSVHWSYGDIAQEKLEHADSAVDMGTGGGEFIAALPKLPPHMFATEQYEPNVSVARERLEPLGVEVLYLEEETEPPFSRTIPLESNSIDVVINRHESYTPSELRRILRRGGTFVSQQVGSLNELTLKQFFEQTGVYVGNWNLESAVIELEAHGFTVEYADEHIGSERFTDVGAIVYFLRAVPWLIEDFDVERFSDQLRRMHYRIVTRGYFETEMHRFFFVARKT
jgi:SAM-dependent methyltransferase